MVTLRETLGKRVTVALFSVVVTLPLSSSDGWLMPSYQNKPNNDFTFSDKGLLISVKESASPLFYPLANSCRAQRLTATGTLLGLPHLGDAKEGIGQGDDFALRVGVVEGGDKTLNWFQRLFAPAWLRELTSQNQTLGVKQVHFFNIAQQMEVGNDSPASQVGPFRGEYRPENEGARPLRIGLKI